jgi:protein-tyrosine phosphatase
MAHNEAQGNAKCDPPEENSPSIHEVLWRRNSLRAPRRVAGEAGYSSAHGVIVCTTRTPRNCEWPPPELILVVRPHMIDIHCHILPGLDDGAETFEIACAMAESAIADGVTHIIGTPHASPTYTFVPELIAQKREELQAKFEGRLTFGTGCDFHLSFENLRDIRKNQACYTLNQKNYLLVEFADYSIPPSMDQSLHELQLAGLHPVITHPERNPLIRAQPQRLFQWLRQGCYAQITAGSLHGRFGKPAQDTAEAWLEGGAVHFLASDAHNTTTRPLKLKETFELVAKRKGQNVARALLVDNPLAAFEGRPLPYVPELSADFLEEQAGARSRPRRKKFWLF